MKNNKNMMTDSANYVEVKNFENIFDVLNYTPLSYLKTVKYAEFLEKSHDIFGAILEKTDADDLCSNMLDSYIDGIVGEMKSDARHQYIEHMYTIERHKNILAGEIQKAEKHLENLKQDLEGIDRKIEFCRNAM